MAWHWLGLTHGNLLQKREATEAIKKAIELDPQNIEYRKNYERVKAISGSQRFVEGVGKTARTGFTVIAILQLLLFAGLIISFIFSLQTPETYTGQYLLTGFGHFVMWLVLGMTLAGLGKIFEWLS